jgi:hypothetical protein
MFSADGPNTPTHALIRDQSKESYRRIDIFFFGMSDEYSALIQTTS